MRMLVFLKIISKRRNRFPSSEEFVETSSTKPRDIATKPWNMDGLKEEQLQAWGEFLPTGGLLAAECLSASGISQKLKNQSRWIY
jgi:hypothetical protein